MAKTPEEQIIDHLHHIGKRLDVMQTHLAFLGLGQKSLIHFVHQDREVTMYLPDALTDNIQKYIMEKRAFWEEGLLVKARGYLAGCRSAIDVGANIGNHTLFLSLVADVEKVIAIEPQAHVFRILERNVAVNALSGVTTINAAVAADVGHAEIGLHRNSSFHGTTYRVADGGGVPVIKLDDVAADPVDFIKIDVEGMQMDVLAGAKEILQRDRPKLWIELRRNHGEFEPANTFLTELGLGYKPVPLGGDDILFVTG